MKRSRKMTAVIEVTWLEREDDETQCGVPQELHELTGELVEKILLKLDTDETEVETVAILSLEEQTLPCSHLVATRIRQTARESGFSAWECLLSDERVAMVCYLDDALVVQLDGKEIARETDLFGTIYKVLDTQEMLDFLGFGVQKSVSVPAA